MTTVSGDVGMVIVVQKQGCAFLHCMPQCHSAVAMEPTFRTATLQVAVLTGAIIGRE